MKTIQEFGLININRNSLIVESTEQATERVTVSHNVSGLFTIKEFALIQFLKGAFEYGKSSTHCKIEVYDLICKLSETAVYSNAPVELDRKEVQQLKKLLEARMAHCENEREQGNPNFQQDTYIGQKLLLLDLREWLLGDIIS